MKIIAVTDQYIIYHDSDANTEICAIIEPDLPSICDSLVIKEKHHVAEATLRPCCRRIAIKNNFRSRTYRVKKPLQKASSYG